MSIQSIGSNSVSSGSTTGGTGVTAPTPNAGVSNPVPVQKPPADPKTSAADLKNAVDNINKHLKQNDTTTVQFTIDQASKREVVQMVDSGTGDVIGQYPSKAVLAISAAIDQEMKRGVLLNQKA